MLAIPRLARARRWGLLSTAAGLLLFALAACDVPEAPRWDVGVAVPFSSDVISIKDILPDVVDTAVVGGVPVFTVQPQRDSVGYRLGDMCSACGLLDGSTAPVPGFDYNDSLDVRFPADLVSVELLAGRVGLSVFNGLNFDPLRPGAGGYVAIAVRDMSSAALLDSIFISGASESFPPNTSKQLEFDVSSGTITDGIRAVIYVHSPADGQTVTIQNDLRAGFAAMLDQIQVSRVTAVVDGKTLEENFAVDVDADLREQLADRVQSGKYEIELIHNADLSGDFDVSIAGAISDLFSDDPGREVRLGSLTLTAGQVQSGSLTPSEIELLASFTDVYVGYRSQAWGTWTGPLGRTNLSRFTPDVALQVNFKVITEVRVGE